MLHQNKNLWTKHEDETIKTLRATGMPFREIALRLPGRTVNAIGSRLTKLKPKSDRRKPNRLSEEEIEAILQLKSEGKSVAQAAQMIGRSKTLVETIFAKEQPIVFRKPENFVPMIFYGGGHKKPVEPPKPEPKRRPTVNQFDILPTMHPVSAAILGIDTPEHRAIFGKRSDLSRN